MQRHRARKELRPEQLDDVDLLRRRKLLKKPGGAPRRLYYCISLFMLLAQAINSGVQRKIGAARKHYVQPCKVRRELGEQRFPNF